MKLLFCYYVFKKFFNLFIVYMDEKILELQPQLNNNAYDRNI